MESNIGKEVIDFNGTLVIPKKQYLFYKKKPNEFSIVNRAATSNRKAAYSICFSSFLKSSVKNYKYVALYVSKVSNKVMFVFNNSKGFTVSKRVHDDCVAVYGKELISSICKHFDIKSECAVLHISSNLSKNTEMATFEIYK